MRKPEGRMCGAGQAPDQMALRARQGQPPEPRIAGSRSSFTAVLCTSAFTKGQILYPAPDCLPPIRAPGRAALNGADTSGDPPYRLAQTRFKLEGEAANASQTGEVCRRATGFCPTTTTVSNTCHWSRCSTRSTRSEEH